MAMALRRTMSDIDTDPNFAEKSMGQHLDYIGSESATASCYFIFSLGLHILVKVKVRYVILW